MTGRNMNVLKDVALKYVGALDRYRRAMRQGDTRRADDALAEMQELERDVIVIRQRRPA